MLNRQAAVLIAHHGIRVRQNDDVGRYLEVNAPVAAGELVMLLPPNLLLWEEEVPDFQLCIQARDRPRPARDDAPVSYTHLTLPTTPYV